MLDNQEEMRKENKRPVGTRLTPEAIRLLLILATSLGVSQASVIEMAIRVLADQHKIKRNG
jgi:hypothetical protein